MRLADKAGMLLVAGGLGRVVQIGLGVLLARLLQPELYGTYRQIWLLVGGFLPAILISIPMGFYYFLPRLSGERQRTFVWQTTLLVAGLGCLASGVLFIGADLIGAAFHNPALAPVLRAFALYPALYFPGNLLMPVAVSLDRAALGGFASLAYLVAQALLTAGLLLAGVELTTLFRSIVLLAGLNLAFTLLMFRRLLPYQGPRWDGPLVRSQLAYCWPLGLSWLVDTLNVELDKLIVSLRYLPGQFAVFAIGATELPFLDVMRGSVNAVLRPAIAQLHETGQPDAVLRLWHEALRKQGLFAMAFFGFFVAHAQRFITALYTDQYAGAALMFQIYLLLIPLRLLAPGVLLASIGETRELFRASRVNLVVNLTLAVALLPLLGMVGPALATLLASVTATVLQLRRLSDVLRVPVRGLIPGVALLRMALVGVSAGTVSRCIGWLALPAVQSLILAGVVHSVAYIGIAWALNLFTAEDRALLRRWVSVAPLWR